MWEITRTIYCILHVSTPALYTDPVYQEIRTVISAYAHCRGIAADLKRLTSCWDFDVSENVLLAPTSDSRVSRKDDRMIKAVLFDFIFTSDHKP